MKNKKGLTLVETLMALTLFAVMSAGVSAVISSSTRLRGSSESNASAQQYARLVVEKHREYWSVIGNYEKDTTEAAVIPPYVQTGGALFTDLPSHYLVVIEYGCITSNGSSLSNTSGSLKCSQENPPLRTVHVDITDAQGNVKGSLSSEIGRPIARDDN